MMIELCAGIWSIELHDGTTFQFYNGMPDNNPLETYPEFDLGMNWSVDVQPEDLGKNEFETGPEGFTLIPKSLVKRVFFTEFGDIHPAPQIIRSTPFDDAIKKPTAVLCYNCGKAIPVGKPATAVTAGTITEDGFTMDEDPWMTIACETCGSQINDVIAELNTAFASLG